MRRCPTCSHEYDDGVEYCPQDGTALPTATDPLIGQMVGHYRVASLIGEGGMGAVYLAVHPEIGSRVAVKVLHPDLARDKAAVDRFFSEARSVNLIHHENIVNILDLARLPDGRSYIVMEYLEGESLSSKLKKKGPFTPKEAIVTMLPVLAALQAAHERNIIHRDLKPDNIFVTRGGHVKVLDFGIAKLDVAHGGAATRTGALLGTPLYMSPEQAAGRPSQIDHRSDIYSAGIILYELLTGKVPFYAESLYEVITKHLNEPPVPLRQVRPEIPEALEAAVLRALAKEKDQRFPTAAAMAEELSRIEEQLTVVGRAASTSARPATAPHVAGGVAAAAQAAPGPGMAAQVTGGVPLQPPTPQGSGMAAPVGGAVPPAPTPQGSGMAAPVGGAVPPVQTAQGSGMAPQVTGGVPLQLPTPQGSGMPPQAGGVAAAAQAAQGAGMPQVGGGVPLSAAAAGMPSSAWQVSGQGAAAPQGMPGVSAPFVAYGQAAPSFGPGPSVSAAQPIPGMPPTAPAMPAPQQGAGMGAGYAASQGVPPPVFAPQVPQAASQMAVQGGGALQARPRGSRAWQYVLAVVGLVVVGGLTYALGLFPFERSKDPETTEDTVSVKESRAVKGEVLPDAGEKSGSSVKVVADEKGELSFEARPEGDKKRTPAKDTPKEERTASSRKDAPEKDPAAKQRAAGQGAARSDGLVQSGASSSGQRVLGPGGAMPDEEDEEANLKNNVVPSERRGGGRPQGNTGDNDQGSAGEDIYRRLQPVRNVPEGRAPETRSVSGVYRGRIHNLTANVRSTGEMTLKVEGTRVTGYLRVAPPLSGSGPVEGTLSGNNLLLTVRSPQGTLRIRGVILGGTITGGYTAEGSMLAGGMQHGTFTMRK